MGTEQLGCDFCNGKEVKVNNFFDVEMDFYECSSIQINTLNPNYLEIETSSQGDFGEGVCGSGSFEIDYCPYCGRWLPRFIFMNIARENNE